MNEERHYISNELWEEKFRGVHNEIQSLSQLIEFKLDAIIMQTTTTNGNIKNHAERISSLENWRWYIIGIATILGAVGYEILSRI